MLKISSKQLQEIVDLEWQRLRQRVEWLWPDISGKLYPEHPLISPAEVQFWTQQTVNACKAWDMDVEHAYIALAINVLSAVTLRLPQAFVQDMQAYFLASVAADQDADHAMAQQWMRMVLFEQKNLQLKGLI